MKKLMSLLLGVVFAFSILGIASANDQLSTYEQLSVKERKQLEKANFTEEVINLYPLDLIKDLIVQGAVHKGITTKEYDLEGTSNAETDGEVSIMGLDLDKDIKLSLSIAEVTSDRTGSSKFSVYGTYRWLKTPLNRWKDAIAIGWSTPDFTYPVDNATNKILFYKQYNYTTEAGSRYLKNYTHTPEEYIAYGGLGNRFDLSTGLFDGYLSQTVYSTKLSGAAIFVLSYGHSYVTGSPTFGKDTGAFGVTPQMNVDVVQVPFELRY